MAHLAQVILQVQVLSTSGESQEEIQEGLVPMNHGQVQCPEDKDGVRRQRSSTLFLVCLGVRFFFFWFVCFTSYEVKYSTMHSFNKHGAPTGC